MSETAMPGTLRGLQIIHRALLMGQLIFAAVVLLLRYSDAFPPPLSNMDKSMQVLAILLSLTGFFTGSSIFKKKIQQVMVGFPDIKTKAAAYRSACIIQWALLEGPSLFCIICFLLVGNYAYLALLAALMFAFALTAPAKLKAMLLLQINEEDMERF